MAGHHAPPRSRPPAAKHQRKERALQSKEDPRHTGYTGPVIDVHTHFYPTPIWRAVMRWFERERGWSFPFRGDWAAGCAALEARPRVRQYVCCGYAHRPGIAPRLNAFYATLQRHAPKAVSLGCAHQEDADLPGLAVAAFDQGLAGFKIHAHVQHTRLDDPRWFPLYETIAARRGLLLVHAGTAPFPAPQLGFESFRRVLQEFPTLRCVVAHLGCFEPTAFLRAALEHEHLYLDTAYTFLRPPLSQLTAPLDLVRAAAHKILFGTDFPVISHTYDEAVAAIAHLPLSAEEHRAIFFDNARQLLTQLPTNAKRPGAPPHLPGAHPPEIF